MFTWKCYNKDHPCFTCRFWHCCNAQHQGKVNDCISLKRPGSYGCDQTMDDKMKRPWGRKWYFWSARPVTTHQSKATLSNLSNFEVIRARLMRVDRQMVRPVKSKPHLKAGWFWACGDKYVNPTCSVKQTCLLSFPVLHRPTCHAFMHSGAIGYNEV